MPTDLNDIINGHCVYTGHNYVSHLIAMNDGGATFKEIANWIEANIPVEEELVNVASL